jgi:hypothetical protein
MQARTLCAAAILWLTTLTVIPAGAAEPGDDSLVGTTANLEFHSDFWMNLHHVLYAAAWDRRPEKGVARAAGESVGFETALSQDEQRAWDTAVDVYARDVAPKDLLFDYQLTDVKIALGEANEDLAGVALPAALKTALTTAAPIYRAHAWTSDDRANRAWAAEARQHVEELAPEVTRALAARFGTVWPTSPVRVDAVRVGIRQGAYTTIGPPDWIVISTSDPNNQAWAQAEVAFHETSHLLIHPVEQALYVAGRDLHVAVPRVLWHVVLFYTVGEVTREALSRRGVAYEPYLYKTGLFDRAWPTYRPAIESVLPDFVAGKATREDMARALVRAAADADKSAAAAAPKLPNRGEALVAASGTFSFYSDVRTNLHAFLVWNARSPEPIEPKPECLAGLPPGQRAAYEHAHDYYAKAFANGAGELVLLSMRWRLAKYGEINLANPAQIAATVAELEHATPAYEACWWPEHDARNRRWVANLLPRLEANESALRARLAELYGRELARALPVDVVGYANADGAGAVVNPHLLFVSSAARANQGNSSLEMLFQSASHTLFGQRTPGSLWTALQQAAGAAGKPLPQGFSDLLELFTTGKGVQARLAEQGVRDYVPHVYIKGFFERSPPAYREVLERAWQPYVDGRASMDAAVKQLVEALP